MKTKTKKTKAKKNGNTAQLTNMKAFSEAHRKGAQAALRNLPVEWLTSEGREMIEVAIKLI